VTNSRAACKNGSTCRGIQGGSYLSPADFAGAFARDGTDPASGSQTHGFRLAMVPEPSTGLLVATGLLALARWRTTRA
jgi:hypothetical protein